MENNRMSNTFELPLRQGEPPEVGESIPQLQFSDKSPDDIRQALWDWAFSAFPDVREEDTRISVPTSRALWLSEGVEAAHEDVFMPPSGGREFCHLHLDGSIHAVVAGQVEEEILLKNWGKRHPLYHSHGVKEMLVYAARDSVEVEVIKAVIIRSYENATGKTYNPAGDSK